MRRIYRTLAVVWMCALYAINAFASAEWLLSQQQSDGAVTTAADVAIAFQSSAEAVRTLRVLGRDASVGPIQVYIAAETYRGTEHLARQIIAAAEAGSLTGTLTAELLTHQNTDGGFGELPGYQSTPLDTANAVSALVRAGQLTTSPNLAALTYLIAQQGGAGAWTVGSNDPSIYVTSHALDALWQFRHKLPSAVTSAGRARAWLLAQRQADGLWGSNFESALALISLAPLQATQGELAASVNALTARRSANGSWANDVYATALALRAIALASASNANPDLARVSGSVMDGDAQVMLSGVTVRLTGPSGSTRLTDAQGAFTFADIAAGNYALSVEAAGYPALSANLTLKSGQSVELGTLQLLRTASPTVGRIEGHITAVSGAALSGATVQATGTAAVVTDASGRYVINEVPPGNVTITAAKAGYFAAQGTTTLLAGATVNFSAALRDVQSVGFSMRGSFTDASTGQALAGVRVVITGSAQAETLSDASGAVALAGLTPGQISIEVSLAGYATRTALAVANGGQTVDISTALSPIDPSAPSTFELHGKVTDQATGAALAGASVAITGANTVSTVADDQGSYSFTGLVPGAFTVTASAAGYQIATASATAEPLQSIDFSAALVAIDVQPTAIQAVVVDDVSGALIEGASVVVTSESANTTVTTAPNGVFLVRNVAAEETTVTISADGYLPRALTFTPVSGFVNDLGSLPLLAVTHAEPVILTGQVVDSTNNAVIAGVSVTATTILETQTVQSGSDGRFSLSLISGAIADVEFSVAEYATTTFTVLVTADSADLGQVRLRPDGLDSLLADVLVLSVDAGQVSSSPDTYAATGSVTAHLQNRGYVAVPAGTDVVVFEDRNRNGTIDEDEPELGRAALATDLAPGEMRATNVPVAGALSFRDAPVTVLADAAQTVIERSEDNNSGTSVGSCVALPPAASALSPVLKYQWAGSPQSPADNTVFGPVMVGQLSDDNGDGRIDAADVPDLVFSTRGQALTVISGDDGHAIWQSAASTVTGLGSPAIGDIDGDGLNEIVISNGPRTRLLAFEHDGTLKWSVTNGPTHSDTTRDGITLADLNADGVPEIITGRRVYSNTGTLLWQGTGDHGGLISYGTVPIAADVNRDGTLEVIAGRSVYRANGTLLWTQTSAVSDGFNAVGNFDDDDFPEIVLVAAGRVYLLEHTGAIKWGPVTLSGANSRGGAPTVGDFDGDGQPEIGVAGASFYTVLETDGSLKWRKPIQDASSAFTGSSLFDFDGDGRIEVVYADEQNLFIWDGASGTELQRIPNRSGTTLEYPVVADVDGDGRAELVVAANEGNSPGVRVFEGGQGEWMPTRAIWNQSSYHIDNVNDDGSIPAVEAASWLTHNTFRANAAVQRQAEPVADLTAGVLTLIDHGVGQPASLQLRVGNAGASLEAAVATVAFYDGSPTAGGNLLGTLLLPAIPAGSFADVQLDGITSVSAAGTLTAVVDSTKRVTECDELNNTATTPSRPVIGMLSVATSAAVYASDEVVQLRTTVTNPGLFTNTYRVETVVRDADGNVVATLASASVPSLTSGTTQALASSFDSAGLLAGSYQVDAELFDSLNQRLATATAGFELRHDAGAGPAASLRVMTDRPVYHTTDAVLIDTLSRNLTSATLMTGVQLRLEVASPSGAAVLDQTITIGEFVPGAVRSLQRSLALSTAAEGTYGVSGTLLDAAGNAVASATTSFAVENNPVAAIRGTVTASAATIPTGQSLLCSRTTINGGTAAVTALGVRYLVVSLADKSVVEQQDGQIDLGAGGTAVDARSVSTAGYATGDYACILQANLAGQWHDLSYATFQVTAPAIQLEAQLKSEGLGRLLVLMDESNDWPCTSVKDVELWAPFRTRLPADARIEVELLDEQGRRVDYESVALSQYRGTVNQQVGAAADLSIVGASADVLTVKIASNSSLGSGYRMVATATAESLPPVVVESNVMGESCGWKAGHGARFGDFHCSGGHSRSGGTLPPPLSGLPTLAQQRAFLEQELEAAGVSYTIVTEDEAFEQELRTGAYSRYAIFAEHEKLDEQMQKELREAVYRGEGLLDAGQHDHRHHGFDAALGIIPLGRQTHVSAVQLAAPWSDAGTASLSLASQALRIRLNGAQEIGSFVNAHGYDTAATSNDYGRGKSVYVGYDLLAEATLAGSSSLHAALLRNALTQIAPSNSTRYAAEVIPLRLTVTNRAVATPGRAVLPLPAGVTLIDPVDAEVQNGSLIWTFELAANGQQAFTAWVRLPDQAGPVDFDSLVQSGANGSYQDQTHALLTLQAQPRATLAQAKALAQTSIRFMQVRFWLEKTQWWLDRGHEEFALASLVRASDEVIRASHPQATQLRTQIDDAIWILSRDLQ